MKIIKDKGLERIVTVTIIFALVFIGFACHDRLASKRQEWRHYGGDLSQNKFSSLEQITKKNVSQLKQVWQYQDTSTIGTSILFNPLVVKSRMFAFMPSKKLVALDPDSGELLWSFVPDSTDINTWTRGLTYHEVEDGPDVLLFVYGATLYSISAEDGSLIKSFGNGGRVDFYTGLSLDTAMRKRVAVTNNAPGVIFKDLYIVGCKVPDELPSVSGDIRAFNVNTGKLEWIFHTIPLKGEYGYETWPATARTKNGGANCWGGMALDEKRGIVYVPTASPSFDFYGADREGQNLFANCLLALDAKTGKRLWHFQTTHHDLWDRDNGSPPNLVTVTHQGKKKDAVALVTKMGYVFLFDRDNGDPLFPIEERPVSTVSPMPGEKPWPTQPIPTRPAPFTRQGYQREFYESLDSAALRYVTDRLKVDKYSTDVYVPPDLNGSVIVPAAHGGANWGGASYNPSSGVLFVNATDLPGFLQIKDLKKLAANNVLDGETLFQLNCSSCHGKDQKGTTSGPDISEKVQLYSAAKIASVVKKGAEPMPSFQHLPQKQIDNIVAYLKNTSPASALKAKKGDEESGSEEPYGFSGYDFFVDSGKIPLIKPPFGTLNAIDLNSGEIRWQVPLGEDSRLAKKGIKNSGMYNRGGGIATASGLIFIGATGDRKLRAFDQETGAVLWETELPGAANAIPCTYSIDEKQYLTVAVSPNPAAGFKGGYITFSL
ncbi:outer membrane protein assembly factor BamB family protein [Flavitalea antarctica]